MAKSLASNITIGFSNENHEDDDESSTSYTRRESYVEFSGITRFRSDTVDDGMDRSEKIINEIVAMDASYDSHHLPDLSVGNKKLFSSPAASTKIIAEKYGNFHTIDWLRDLAKDRLRHKWLLKEKERGHLFEWFQAWHDHISGWFCVLLVGLGAGLVAGFVDIGSSWMSHLRSGVCMGEFWLNRDQCCWTLKKGPNYAQDILDFNVTFNKYQIVECDNWYSWPRIFGLASSNYFVSFLVHVLISLAFAFTAAILVKVYAPYACGSGVPEIKTILSGFVIRGYLGKWTLLIKAFGMMLGTSAGLTLGKEGPFVHVASCCGNIFAYLFPKFGRNEAKKREILSAAAASGVAVAFGAPIGGVLFSLEEVSYYFPLKTLWRSFFCAMFGAFILRTVNPYGKGHDVLFFIDYQAEWLFFELVPFVILGALGGVFGWYFIRCNIYWCRIRKTTALGRYPITEVMVITLLTSSLCFFNEYTRMSMSELVKRLVGKCGLADESLLCDYIYANITTNGSSALLEKPIGFGPGMGQAMWQLFFALVLYLFLLIFTFGIKIPCGLFVPSLCIGAITGRMIGTLTEYIAFTYPSLVEFECKNSAECVTPGVYALIGACAFLGGATRMTVSLVVIMVELTSGMSLIVPLMVAAFTAKFVGELLCPIGIYDAHINLNGYPFLDNKEDYEFSAKACNVMKTDTQEKSLVTLTQDGMSIGYIKMLMKTTNIVGYPIIVSKESQVLYGFILKRDLELAFEKYQEHDQQITDDTLVKFDSGPNTGNNQVRLYKLVDLAPMCVAEQTPMEIVIDLFRKMGVSIVMVTNLGHLVGVITKKDILKHLASEKEKKNTK